MIDPDTMDLAAEVARLKAREAERDRHEAEKLAVSPLPIPRRNQAQIEIEESLRPAALAWKAEVERRQAHMDEQIKKNAPAVAKLDARVREIKAQIGVKESSLAELREQLRVVEHSYPAVVPAHRPWGQPLRAWPKTRRGRK